VARAKDDRNSSKRVGAGRRNARWLTAGLVALSFAFYFAAILWHVK
jgi:hypothetical protein